MGACGGSEHPPERMPATCNHYIIWSLNKNEKGEKFLCVIAWEFFIQALMTN